MSGLDTRSAPPEPTLAPPPTDPGALLAELEAAFQLRHTDPVRGEAWAHRLRAAALAAGLEHPAAVADMVLVYCEDISDSAEGTLDRLLASYRVCARVQDAQNQLRAADLLSTIYEGIGDYPSALDLAETALGLARAIGDRLFEGYALSSLIGVFTATGDFDLAKRKAAAALEVAEGVGSVRLRSRLRLRLGRVHRLAGELEPAREAIEQARGLARAHSIPYVEIDALTELGRLAELRGDLREAEARFDEARLRSDSDVWRVAGSQTLLGLARIYLATDRVEEARAVIEELRILAQGFHMYPVLAEGSALFAEVCERRGEPAAALAALREHVAFREKVMEAEAQRAVKRFEAKLEIAAAQKDAEIYRLRYIELETMQTQLLEAERMAAVGALAAGLAHEMNTPLGVLRSNLDTSARALARLVETLGSDIVPGAQAALAALASAERTSRSAAERLEGWVTGLRRFTRLDEAERQRFDVVEGLRTTLDLARTSLPEGVRLEADLAPVPEMEGWPGRLNQAFLTLLMNAVEAVGDAGRVGVEVRAEAGGVVVRIADDGPGIPTEVQPRLFEPSFEDRGARTRFRVGLATVRSIVVRHGGTIAFDTAPGAGTTFTLRFPGQREGRREETSTARREF